MVQKSTNSRARRRQASDQWISNPPDSFFSFHQGHSARQRLTAGIPDRSHFERVLILDADVGFVRVRVHFWIEVRAAEEAKLDLTGLAGLFKLHHGSVLQSAVVRHEQG